MLGWGGGRGLVGRRSAALAVHGAHLEGVCGAVHQIGLDEVRAEAGADAKGIVRNRGPPSRIAVAHRLVPVLVTGDGSTAVGVRLLPVQRDLQVARYRDKSHRRAGGSHLCEDRRGHPQQPGGQYDCSHSAAPESNHPVCELHHSVQVALLRTFGWQRQCTYRRPAHPSRVRARGIRDWLHAPRPQTDVPQENQREGEQPERRAAGARTSTSVQEISIPASSTWCPSARDWTVPLRAKKSTLNFLICLKTYGRREPDRQGANISATRSRRPPPARRRRRAMKPASTP